MGSQDVTSGEKIVLEDHFSHSGNCLTTAITLENSYNSLIFKIFLIVHLAAPESYHHYPAQEGHLTFQVFYL